MKLKVNGERFDELQPWFVGEIIERIREELESAGIPDIHLQDLTGSIAFSICSLIDGSSDFVAGDQEITPYLAFSETDAEMFYPGGNSYLHEYVFGVLDEVFKDDA